MVIRLMMAMMIIRLMMIFPATTHQGGHPALLRGSGRWQASNYSQGTNSTRAAHQVIIIHLLMIWLVKILLINDQMRQYVPFIAMAPIDPCQYTAMKMRCK